ncbi:MAG TPA: hypothetical protein DHV36_17635 [Desulfobacteraceae bacterium]|nr:hypothetical protein [Desulfobacteraceae bacterium]
MLGFLKKTKKGKEEANGQPQGDAPKAGKSKKGAKIPPVSAETDMPVATAAPPKKRFSIKKLIFVLLILGAIGGSGYFVYTLWFKAPDPGVRQYRKVMLEHVNLPPEMLRFSFDQFPEFYDALVAFNREVKIFDREIARIEAIGAKYPDQRKIADSQKKVWEKGKNTLLKEFAKLEKPVKETYVLYQVNPARGQEQITALTKDLTAAAQAAVRTAQEQTKDLGDMADAPPEGIIQGTLDKIKKIFL